VIVPISLTGPNSGLEAERSGVALPGPPGSIPRSYPSCRRTQWELRGASPAYVRVVPNWAAAQSTFLLASHGGRRRGTRAYGEVGWYAVGDESRPPSNIFGSLS